MRSLLQGEPKSAFGILQIYEVRENVYHRDTSHLKGKYLTGQKKYDQESRKNRKKQVLR